MNERKQILDESLSALALVAMRDTGADGFAYFRCADKPGGLRLAQASGTSIPEEALFDPEALPVVVHFPLRLSGATDGRLAFVFRSREKAGTAQPRLTRLVAAIEKVWAAQSLPQAYRDILERITALETELVDSKIASRAQGVLRGRPDHESVDAIIRHVESVLRPSTVIRTLDQILRELEEEVEERKWTDQAKAILQEAYGMSEDEAHSYLRKLSRQSRRRLADVARQVIEETLKRPADL